MMPPGFYVVRMPHSGAGSRLMVESRVFQPFTEVPTEGALSTLSLENLNERVRSMAEGWADFIQQQHPKDDVFVIERPPTDHNGKRSQTLTQRVGSTSAPQTPPST